MKKIFIIVFALCTIFNWVSANYERNIDDEIKIHEFKIKLEKYLKTLNNSDEIREKYRYKILKKLWRTHNEIKWYWPNFNDISKTYNEYFLKNLYVVFMKIDEYNYGYKNEYNKLKILENDYIRTIARSNDLFIDNASVYLKSDNWWKSHLLYFLEIWENIKLKNYIEDNLLDKNFIWKCEVVKKNISKSLAIWKDVFYIQYTQEYSEKVQKYAQNVPEEERLDILKYQNCWKYWYGSIYRLTDTLVIYYPHPIEYLGEDFSLIEIKK